MTTRIPPREWEALSAYLDGQISASERSRLEARLLVNAELRTALDQLRRTRAMLRSMPRRRAPRNYTLTPQMVGAPRQVAPRSYPILRLASALATLLLILVLIGDFQKPGGFWAPAQANPVMQLAKVESTELVELKSAPVEGEAGDLALSAEAAVAQPEEPLLMEASATEAAAAPQPIPEIEAYPAPYPAPAASEAFTSALRLAPDAQLYAAPPQGTPEARLEVMEKSLEQQPAENTGEEILDQASTSSEAGLQANSSSSPAPFWNPFRLVEVSLAVVAISTGLAAFLIWRRSRRLGANQPSTPTLPEN